MIKLRLSLIILLLTILFVALKACGVIGWSWIWVFSPVWMPFALLFLGWFVIFVFSWLLFRDVKNKFYKEFTDVD